MAKRLFIGGIPFQTTEEELREYFSKVGEIESISLITDKYTGKSKGFAFVEYKNEDDSQKAINTLNDSEIGGRRINVAEARPMERRDDRPRRDFNRGGEDRRSYGRGGRDFGDRRGGRSSRFGGRGRNS